MTIFILEDNAMRSLYFMNWATTHNHKITLTNNVEDAKIILLNVKFDLLCLDHDLGEVCPDNLGYKVCEDLNKTINNDTDILIHSWNASGVDRMIHILSNSAHKGNVVHKEFETDEFYAYLNSIIKK